MDKSDRILLKVIAGVLVGFVLLQIGATVGRNEYKQSCERITSADNADSWLECKL